VAVVTIGQYLQPTLRHLPVEEYVHPETFDEYREYGERLGFRAVFSGPMVRSSFMAELVRDRSMGSNAGD
jgi:lipoic acid synthetase